jgi:hypothetical protein
LNGVEEFVDAISIDRSHGIYSGCRQLSRRPQEVVPVFLADSIDGCVLFRHFKKGLLRAHDYLQ